MSSIRDSLLVAIEKSKSCSEKIDSVSALAKYVGVSRSTIYKYYPDVVVKLRQTMHDCAQGDVESEGLRRHLIRKQLDECKKIIGALAKICSDQLIAMRQAELRHKDELESKNLRIVDLERKLKKYTAVRSLK